MNSNPAILVVDDEPDLLDNIGMALEYEEFNILAARNGVEALVTLESQPVDLILADVAMPDMNGYQLYERVRQNPNWGAIPFIFLTARKMNSDIRYGKELGVDDYLTKPISAGTCWPLSEARSAAHGNSSRRRLSSPPKQPGNSVTPPSGR
jgi:CheY-like chemotaxis protein